MSKYGLPIGPDGVWGTEWVSFFQINGDTSDPWDRGVVHLLQLNPGRCTFFAVVNGYQSVTAHPLDPIGLAAAYQTLMAKVGRPLQRDYDPRNDVRRVYEAHGGSFRLIDGNLVGIARAAVEARMVVLIFEDRGTRSVASTDRGTFHILNHFAKPTSDQVRAVFPLDFVRSYEDRFVTLAFEPEIVARMLGLR